MRGRPAGLFLCGVCFVNVLSPSVSFYFVCGADSNSEYSSGSGVLLSDSPESSPAPSSVHSEDRRSSGGACPQEQDWKETAGQLDRDAVQKELGWWVVGEEE